MQIDFSTVNEQMPIFLETFCSVIKRVKDNNIWDVSLLFESEKKKVRKSMFWIRKYSKHFPT